MRTTIFPFLIVLAASVHLNAQKLPNKQERSMWAPPNPKINGQVDEWGNQFEAYNHATDIYYTLANDDQYLYLLIHTDKARVIEKIVEGGISFIIKNKENGNVGAKAEILFPDMPLPICKGVLVAAGKPLTGKTFDDNKVEITENLNGEAVDNKLNALKKANQQLLDNLKVIKLISNENFQDTISGVSEKTPYYRTLPLHRHQYKIIPIDNKDGIEAMTQFDKNAELTYELKLPLKYCGDFSDVKNKFSYQIIIHGRGEDGRPGNTWMYGPPPDLKILDQDLEEPTDFSGEYTLAKKP